MMTVVVCLAGLSLSAPAPFPRRRPVPTDEDVCVVPGMRFKFPVRVRAGYQDKLRELRLFVSADQGRTWRLAQTIKPGEDGFRFTAPRPGVYWFRLQSIHKDGAHEPPEVRGTTADQKVLVRPARARPAPAAAPN